MGETGMFAGAQSSPNARVADKRWKRHAASAETNTDKARVSIQTLLSCVLGQGCLDFKYGFFIVFGRACFQKEMTFGPDSGFPTLPPDV